VTLVDDASACAGTTSSPTSTSPAVTSAPSTLRPNPALFCLPHVRRDEATVRRRVGVDA
jgi:hypothetical protein